MRKTSLILTVTLILSLAMSLTALASEKGSYAERSRVWVDLEGLEHLEELEHLDEIIAEQLEAIEPILEYEIQPVVELELERMLEDLGPMLEDIHIEVRESLHENMVDVREIVRESMRGIDFDHHSRVRVNHYESREERVREEIEVLEQRLERLRERLEEMDENL